MASKSLKILSLSIFFLLVLTSFTSALSIDFDQNLPVSAGDHEILITVNDAEAGTDVTFSVQEDLEIDFNIATIHMDEKEITGNSSLNYNIPDESEFKFGKSYSIILTAKNGEEEVSKTLSFEEVPFYNGDNKGDLDLSDIDFNTVEGFGDDEEYWYPLDEVEVDFEIENVGDWDVEDIEIEACLLDTKQEKCIFTEKDMDIDNDDFDLDSGDDKKIKISFQVDADELKEGNTDYVFYAKAVGKIDDKDSEFNGEETGIDSQKNIKIVTDDEFVILKDIEFSETISCGSSVKITADVWNIGDEDQDDVYVILYNKELGINEKFKVGDIDSLEKEDLDATIIFPEDAEEKYYTFTFWVYNEEEDLYENDEDEESEFYFDVEVKEGSCVIVPSVSITADLISESVAGKELTIKSTIKNIGSSTETYNLELENYEDWAVLKNIDSTSLVLNSGESKEVIIQLIPNKDITGDMNLNLRVLSGGKDVIAQPISVFVEEAPTNFFSRITGKIIGEGNGYLWIIGALNIALVTIIIVVALKVTKKE